MKEVENAVAECAALHAGHAERLRQATVLQMKKAEVQAAEIREFLERRRK